MIPSVYLFLTLWYRIFYSRIKSYCRIFGNAVLFKKKNTEN